MATDLDKHSALVWARDQAHKYYMAAGADGDDEAHFQKIYSTLNELAEEALDTIETNIVVPAYPAAITELTFLTWATDQAYQKFIAAGHDSKEEQHWLKMKNIGITLQGLFYGGAQPQAKLEPAPAPTSDVPRMDLDPDQIHALWAGLVLVGRLTDDNSPSLSHLIGIAKTSKLTDQELLAMRVQLSAAVELAKLPTE